VEIVAGPAMTGQFQKNSARTTEAPTESYEPIFDPKDHPDDGDILNTKAFVHEIFEAAKHCSGANGESERFLEDIADFLFGKCPAS
jgi:hypothetical protein